MEDEQYKSFNFWEGYSNRFRDYGCEYRRDNFSIGDFTQNNRATFVSDR